jgi:hypothetical protein
VRHQQKQQHHCHAAKPQLQELLNKLNSASTVAQLAELAQHQLLLLNSKRQHTQAWQQQPMLLQHPAQLC